MIELPESMAFAKLGKRLFKGLTIMDVTVFKTPHKFCWINSDDVDLSQKLTGKTISDVDHRSHYIRFMLNDGSMLICAEDITLEYKTLDQESTKHQLMLRFNNDYILEFKVKLYAFLVYGLHDDLLHKYPYYKVAYEAIEPLSPLFTYDYFLDVTALNDTKGSVKQALSTNQHIPGLGNGILQDILFDAKLNPKQKISILSDQDKRRLYTSLLHVIDKMTFYGGRSSVNNFIGEKGSYEVLMSNDRVTCPICQTALVKEAYLGGKVIYCPICQPI